MKPMWLGSFQIVQVETRGSGAAADLGAEPDGEPLPDPAPVLDPPDPPDPVEPEPPPLSTLNGNVLCEPESVRWNDAVCEPKIEWSKSESLERAWPGGGDRAPLGGRGGGGGGGAVLRDVRAGVALHDSLDDLRVLLRIDVVSAP